MMYDIRDLCNRLNTPSDLATLIVAYSLLLCFRAPMPVLLYSWFALRKEAEAFFDMKVTHACPKIGKQNYLKMDLSHAVMPLDKLPFVVPDDSPDRIEPIAEGGYDFI
jgi:hypothetical protein